MKFTLPELKYSPDALTGVISQATVEYHYGKHERAYIDNLNRLIEGTEYVGLPYEHIIRRSEGAIFNNAAQAWNHILYFIQFSPDGLREPKGLLRRQIDKAFGSLDEFKAKFEEAGASIFGSGWVWLSRDTKGDLYITQTANAGNPITDGLTPLLTFDVWEHAYYLDWQNRRPDYLHALWKIVDWSVVEARYFNL